MRNSFTMYTTMYDQKGKIDERREKQRSLKITLYVAKNLNTVANII